ncbi:MAG: ABC transporter permease, partial [Longimicrobiales bacterium]
MNDSRPPALAERWLLKALGGGDSARVVVGDLNEDHALKAAKHGSRRAALWYWRESLELMLSSGVTRSLLRIKPGNPSRGDGEMGSFMSWVQDGRYALRAVSRDLGFLMIASLIIGLGVGASTAVFSVLSPLLLQPLPFEDPGNLVWVANGEDGGGRSAVTSRTSNLRDFRELSRSFDGLTGYNAFFDQASYNLIGVGQPERLVGVGIADDFLDVVGVAPLLGRDFDPEEGLWDGRPAVILTHGLWTRRFGADPSVVGQALNINDQPREVVGVLPPSFDFSSIFTPGVDVDFLLPWAISDETDQWGNTTSMIGRLRPGATIEGAQAELDNIVAGLQEADPDRWGLGASVSGLQDQIARPFKSAMLLLAAAAGAVMLIVCVNLSNMLLARSPRRRREMAVRRTMGATRGRLVRQLLIESVAVSLCGAVLGVGIALLATRFVTGTSGLEIPLLNAVSVDLGALAFTVVIAVLAGLAVGVVPALQVAEAGEAEALSGSSRGSSAGKKSRRLRELLVVSEVAMACVLLILGGLVFQSFQKVMDVELGFDAEQTVAWQVATTRDFDNNVERDAFYDALIGGVLAVPGVEAAAFTDALPLGRNRSWGTQVVGVTYEDDEGAGFFPHLVDHRYLETMAIPLVSGRRLTADDHSDSSPVAIVNETAQRLHFPDGQAVGHFFTMWFGEVEVVGVVG